RPPTEEDPRVVEPLPWAPLGHLPPLLPSAPAALLAALLGLSVAGLVLPGVLLVLAVRRRGWGLCWLAVTWLAMMWGAAYLVFLARCEQEAGWAIYQHGTLWLVWQTGYALLLRALIGLPAVAFVGTALVWLRRRQWLRLGLLPLA